jgi:hypothetical protein
MMEDGSTGTALSLVDTWPFLGHIVKKSNVMIWLGRFGVGAAQGTRHDVGKSQVSAVEAALDEEADPLVLAQPVEELQLMVALTPR